MTIVPEGERTEILAAINLAWAEKPYLSFGQLMEEIELKGWDLYLKDNGVRFMSARLANLPNIYFVKGSK